MDTPEDYDALADLVDQHDDVLTVEMRLLRDVHDVGRLGKHVRENISKKLNGVGLGHFPKDELPSSQYNDVRLYRLGSPAGSLIEAVVEPGEENDREIQKAVNSDARETIERVKELVCDV